MWRRSAQAWSLDGGDGRGHTHIVEMIIIVIAYERRQQQRWLIFVFVVAWRRGGAVSCW